MTIEKYVDSRNHVSYRMRDAKMIYTNFAGEAGQYNDAGNRNFNILLDKKDFDFLTDEGFRPRERDLDGADPQYMLKINVRFKNDPTDTRNPKVLFKTKYGNKRLFAEHTSAVIDGEQVSFSPIDILDWADIDNINLAFNEYQSPKSDHKTAYLQLLIATKHEDPFEDEFYSDQDEPDSAQNTMEFHKIDPDLKSID